MEPSGQKEQDKQPDAPQEQPNQGATLEGSGVDLDDAASNEEQQAQSADAEKAKQPAPKKSLRQRLSKVNIYFLGFILVLIVAVMVAVIAFQKSRKETNSGNLTSQTLSPSDLNTISGNDVTIGDAQQTLRVQSNAVFSGQVLIQGSTEIAGTLKVNNTLSINDINVTGTGSIQDAQLGKLAVTGNASVQGNATVQGSLNVTGGGSFGGAITAPQITINTLTLNNDLKLNSHIDAGGSTPGRSNGSLGSGGTASNSGTDTAGTVNINTGSGPSSCLVTINFSKAFNGTPHVSLTAASSDAGNLHYYVSRNTSGFTICGTNTSSSKVYIFDYIVID